MEALAFAAGAALARRDAARAANLDASLAAEIARSSREESGRFADDIARLTGAPAAIDGLVTPQQDARQLAQRRHPRPAPVQAEVAPAVEAARAPGKAARRTHPAPATR